MLDLRHEPQPKYLFQRIINFIIVTLLIMIAPVLLGIAALQKSVALQVLCVLIMFLIYAAIGYYAYNLLKKTTIKAIFHKPNTRHWQHIWFIIGVFSLMICLEYIISFLRINLTGVSTTANQTAIDNLTSNLNVTMVGMIIYGVFLAPVVEEIIFRGLVINYFFRQSWWWASIILSGLLFAFPHMNAIPTNLADLLGYLIYMLMGMVLAFVYKKTGNLQDSIMIHFINNAITMLPMLIMAISKAM
ncbi:type II CAAX endopeptidase family protein [uncultured Leuconostoc sp.]|uniref:CPBP family intramembrane glutamic endopeptidase n=1 Tax=uncultured Leuconostoc sp. TaxID=173262 RepID=UPI0025EB0FAD|nr:type II CAAX endopeptidase family protein [uncultured Leuconostoc sp.]